MILSPGEESLKTIKKELKETFERIGRDKEVFDQTRDSLQKYRIWQSTEKSITAAG